MNDLLGGALSLDTLLHSNLFLQAQVEIGEVYFSKTADGAFSGQRFQPIQFGGRVGYPILAGTLITFGYLGKSLPIYAEAEDKIVRIRHLQVDTFPLFLSYSTDLTENLVLSSAVGWAFMSPFHSTEIDLKGGDTLSGSLQLSFESWFAGWRLMLDRPQLENSKQTISELGAYVGYRHAV